MSEKHLDATSPMPCMIKGRRRIYSQAYCPFSQRVRLVLAHKGIECEVVNINVKDKPVWFLDKNPLGQVPVLELDGQVVSESAICMEYLNEIFPEPPLMPTDPYDKARMKMLMERFNKVTLAYVMILHQRDARSAHRGKAAIQETIKVLEGAITGPFFGGDAPNLLDFFLWPYFEKRQYLNEKLNYDILPKTPFPKMSAWVSAMSALPAAQATATDMACYHEVVQAYAQNKMPPFDIAINQK